MALFQGLSDERHKCLDTLLQIAEFEEYYQTLASEVDTRALQLSVRSCPADDPSFCQHTDAFHKVHNACIYAVRNTWDWLSQAFRCMEVHLRNAATYHQFYHEVKHCDEGLAAITARLQAKRGPNEQKQDAHLLIKEVRDVTKILLDYQSKISSLFERSVDIVPISLRKEPVTTPLRCSALVSYHQSQVKVDAFEQCLLLDNTEPTKWKIRNSKGEEGYIPAIVFLIPPPNKDAVLNAQRLRQQQLVTWKDCLKLAKRRCKTYYDNYLKELDQSRVHCLNPTPRNEVDKCLEEMTEFFSSDLTDCDENRDFKETMDEWRAVIMEMQGTSRDTKGQSSTVQVQWKANQRLLRHLEEFSTYVGAFGEEYASTHRDVHCLVTDEDSDSTFLTSAYIERLKPVDVSHLLPEIANETPSIHHMTIAEKAPNVYGDGIDNDEEVEEEMYEEYSETVTTDADEYSSTVRETRTFVIVGVIDPRSEAQMSIYEAITDGVISQTQGLYRNPDTGESMPIPEAMNRGLILVEFTNSSIEQESSIKRGMIKTTTTRDSASYSVKGVVDPATGRKISVAEAVERGIFDQATGHYINPRTGAKMSITDAIEKGLLEVDEPERKLHGNVRGVVDPVTGRRLSMSEAVERGIIDEATGQYVNPQTGEKMSIAKAIEKGLIDVSDSDRKLNGDVKGVIDPVTGRMISMDEAVERGIIDEASGQYINPKTGIKMSIAEAIEKGLIDAGESGRKPNGNIRGVVDPITGRMLSMAEAVERGIIDQSTGQYINPQTGVKMSFSDAIDKGLIDADVSNRALNGDVKGVVDPVTGRTISMAEAVERGIIDQATGQYINPQTGVRMSISDAIEKGLLDVGEPDKKANGDVTSFSVKGVVDPATGRKISVIEAMEKGIIDHATGHYIDPRTGAKMSITDAIEKGLIEIEDPGREDHGDTTDFNSINGIIGGDRPDSDQVEEEYIISGVIDPKTKKKKVPTATLR